MQRSSESIASLAAALAKAQTELLNPEKSLTATISNGRSGGPERSFRYAPLSSGLDIVRKTLGQHEIATVQTTAFDQTTRLVNLTTLLAHASGEWIASDWPVCAIAETANPQRMGAALTYARRYALFTLVGITGEDDLDAPDLATPTTQTLEPEKTNGSGNGRLNGGQHHHAQLAPLQPGAKARLHAGAPKLSAEPSAQLRDRLLAELGELRGDEDAALWAKRCLPEKNRLTAVDVQRVEEAFRARLVSLTTGITELSQTPTQQEASLPACAPDLNGLELRRCSEAIDKSVLTLAEPRRIRDRHHVRYVATNPCLICGRQPCDAHHLRFAQTRALGRKVSDEFTVPLCRGHHRELHRHGNEEAWWKRTGIDPTVTARTLWLDTHSLVSGSDDPHGDAENTNGGAKDSTAVPPTEKLNSKRPRRIDVRTAKRKVKPDKGDAHHGVA